MKLFKAGSRVNCGVSKKEVANFSKTGKRGGAGGGHYRSNITEQKFASSLVFNRYINS